MMNINVKTETISDYNNSTHRLKKEAFELLPVETNDKKNNSQLEINVYTISIIIYRFREV